MITLLNVIIDPEWSFVAPAAALWGTAALAWWAYNRWAHNQSEKP